MASLTGSFRGLPDAAQPVDMMMERGILLTKNQLARPSEKKLAKVVAGLNLTASVRQELCDNLPSLAHAGSDESGFGELSGDRHTIRTHHKWSQDVRTVYAALCGRVPPVPVAGMVPTSSTFQSLHPALPTPAYSPLSAWRAAERELPDALSAKCERIRFSWPPLSSTRAVVARMEDDGRVDDIDFDERPIVDKEKDLGPDDSVTDDDE
jgi:hypothetical protein